MAVSASPTLAVPEIAGAARLRNVVLSSISALTPGTAKPVPTTMSSAADKLPRSFQNSTMPVSQS